MVKSFGGHKREYIGSELSSLLDIADEAPSDENILVYNASRRKWEPRESQHQKITPVDIITEADETYTINQMLGGVILREAGSANRTDTTDTAANIVSGFRNPTTQSGFSFFVKNVSVADSTIDMVGGQGVTVVGGTLSSSGESKTYKVKFTNVTPGSESVEIYSHSDNHTDESHAWKRPCHVCPAASVNLATDLAAGQTLDGHVLEAGNRVLLKEQTTKTENGVWDISSGAPKRPSDFAVGTSVGGSIIFVKFGTTNADKGFIVSTDPPNDRVDIDDLEFKLVSSSGSSSAGDGISKVGDTLSVDSTVLRNTGSQVVSGTKTFSDTYGVGFGAANDLLVVHDGTDSSVTSKTGNLYIDNTNATGQTLLSLGSTDTSTSFQIRASSGPPLFKCQGDGTIGMLGSLQMVDDLEIQSDNKSVKIGSGADLELVHDGSSSKVTSKTGLFYLENTDATGHTLLTLGSTDANTSFQIRASSGPPLFKCQGDGTIGMIGELQMVDNLEIQTDNKPLKIGHGGDLEAVHDGTNSLIKSHTGDFVVDNDNATGSTIMRLGADTDAVDFQIQQNSEEPALTVYGDKESVLHGPTTFQGTIAKQICMQPVSTAGAKTYSAYDLFDGYIERDPNGADRTDVLPSAASIKAAIKGCTVGQSFQFTIANTGSGSHKVTMSAGTGGTMSGLSEVEKGDSRNFIIVVTSIISSSETYECIDIGTRGKSLSDRLDSIEARLAAHGVP
ncbi:MAG: hypothetical protein GY818_00480 [Planctomycetaceae bacterium]|nr:hypothetical protein [Planctomycetaceae bacterium]